MNSLLTSFQGRGKSCSLSDSDTSSTATNCATNSEIFIAPQPVANVIAPNLGTPIRPTGLMAKILPITIYVDNTRLAEINREFKAKNHLYFYMAVKVKDGVRLQTSTYNGYIGLQTFLEELKASHQIYRLANNGCTRLSFTRALKKTLTHLRLKLI